VSIRDLRGNVHPSPSACRVARTSPRKNGSNSFSKAASGIGSRHFATDNLNSPFSVSERTAADDTATHLSE